MMKHRFQHWDALRGMVIILMMLDHTRHFFSAATFDPTDLSQSTWGWFLTRWVTHFCAPVFVFLAGAGMAMSSRRGWNLTRYLWIRGALLMFLELTWVNISWGLWANSSSVLQVIWVLGAGMMVMAILAPLPKMVLVSIACILVAVQSQDPLLLQSYQLRFLFYPQSFYVLGWNIQVLYPLGPWLAVMILGWCSGREKWMQSPTSLIGIGSLTLAFFVSGRVWGAMQGWIQGDSLSELILVMLNCQKYPPSLPYLSMTLGPSFIILGLLVGRRDIFTNFLGYIGRWPMFFYLVHLPILSLASRWVEWRSHSDQLLGLYGVWLVLLPPCIFLTFLLGSVKKSHPKSFLKYF